MTTRDFEVVSRVLARSPVAKPYGLNGGVKQVMCHKHAAYKQWIEALPANLVGMGVGNATEVKALEALTKSKGSTVADAAAGGVQTIGRGFKLICVKLCL